MFTVFFSWKISKACLLMRGSWFRGEAVLMVSRLHCIASHHILYKAGLENVSHLFPSTCNWSRTLVFSFKCSFLFVGSLSPLLCHHWVFPLFQRSSPVTFVFFSFWLGLACGLPKTVTETSVQCTKEARMEVVNKILGGPLADWSKCQILT